MLYYLGGMGLRVAQEMARSGIDMQVTHKSLWRGVRIKRELRLWGEVSL
jgi:hypothetical protein